MMSQPSLIVTGADARYFEWLQGTVLSVRAHPPTRPVTLAVFDLGCTAEQRDWLKAHVDVVREPDWDFAFPGREQAPTYLKGLLARPHLRRYFPEFGVYLWLDADAWVQDSAALDLFLQGAERRGLAVVPEIDRGSSATYGSLPQVWAAAYKYYEQPFGAEVAERFCSYPLLNAGVFSLHKHAPHWDVWADRLDQGLQKSCTFLTDQMALNLAVYSTELLHSTEFLPLWCNWTCHTGFPSWDKRSGRLVEPFLPNTPIGILHVTGRKLDRVQVAATDGSLVEISLRYQA
jgi:hypothetical protein